MVPVLHKGICAPLAREGVNVDLKIGVEARGPDEETPNPVNPVMPPDSTRAAGAGSGVVSEFVHPDPT